MSLVDVAGLTIAFGRGAPVVRDLSFTVEPGQCLAIVGESGSGKSVTARALLGLAGRRARVDADRLSVYGTDTRQFRARDWQRLRGRTVGMVLQDALVSLDPLRTVGAEVAEPIRLHETVSRRARAARAVELLREVGVPEPEARAAQYPHQLSGGLRQRALIATALAARPRLVIADEPTTALDVIVQEQILDLLGRITRQDRGLLLISHDLAVVARLADRIVVLRAGEIVESGPTARILTRPDHPYTRQLIAAVPARRDRPTTTPGRPVVEIDLVGKTYSRAERPALSDVSVTLHAGETVAVVGESGSGKSTLARIATGLLAPDTGTVRVAGQAWSALPERTRRPRRGFMQLVHQNPYAAFDPRFTVATIIGEALPRLGRRQRGERVTELLAKVGLGAEFAGRRPHELSGGQRQRVAIARALGPDPSVLICDEPVSALDVSVQAQVLELLAALQRETGIALLFITHDLAVVRQIGDRVLVMKDGRVVEQGAAADVFDRPRHPYTRALLAAIPSLELSPVD
ncbi:ABC transporter ATP-binding protein [Kutzneria buriramensis]|uniref:Peptide/nickel transport system ATP-binding protein n=1 Tax=Kutzneria buriramensis TaxID=1045776 RepID=A0A3E0GTW3_9PSEU|nr:ABC transporter ATP-binding protein [Kutzneria buriramensis]REH27630.1 peptide/nickel transport system ATP-binding protein [Kutzneria buriramensis]